MAKALTSDEIATLLKSITKARAPQVVHTVEYQCIVSWAENIRLQAALLELVLSGELVVDWRDDGPVFRDPPMEVEKEA